jgi:L-ascorbate metabolism protein UlaG (beta-lactamase superfamily)
MTVRHDGLTVEWLGYATIKLAGEDTTVYVDPGRYGILTGEWEPDTEDIGHPPSRDYRAQDGDVVCVTHIHHYDPDGIERVADEDATIIAFEGIDTQAPGRDLPALAELGYEVRRVGTKDSVSVGDVTAWSVPAYNKPDGPNTRPDGTPYHPEGFGCGYVLNVEGTRILYPGDTDVLPGHRTIDCSLFCPPIGQRFTMNRHEAATLADTIDPNLVLPVHYNTFSTQEIDSRAFAADVAASGVPVVLDEGA